MPVEGRTCCWTSEIFATFLVCPLGFLNVVQLITGLTTVSGGALQRGTLVLCESCTLENKCRFNLNSVKQQEEALLNPGKSTTLYGVILKRTHLQGSRDNFTVPHCTWPSVAWSTMAGLFTPKTQCQIRGLRAEVGQANWSDPSSRARLESRASSNISVCKRAV